MDPSSEDFTSVNSESNTQFPSVKKSSIYGKLMQWTKIHGKCLLCGVILFKADDGCVEEHVVKSAQHRESVTRMSKNGIDILDDKIYCKPCNLILPKHESVINHLNDLDHIKWMSLMSEVLMSEYENLYRHLAQDADNIYCTVCKVSLLCDHEIITNHLDSSQHMIKQYESLSKSNAMFNMPDKKVWCKLCNMTFENDIPMLLHHIKDDKAHMAWVLELEGRVQFEGVDTHRYLTILEETKAFCERCGMKIDCNSKALEAHVHSQCHLYRVVQPYYNM